MTLQGFTGVTNLLAVLRVNSLRRTLQLCRIWTVCCAALALWSAAVPALAQAQVAAPEDYEHVIARALTAYAGKRFDEARSLFEQAHTLQPSARTLRGLGLTAFALNRYTVAKPELEAALIDERKPLTREQRDEVIKFLTWMRTNLGTLRLEFSPAHAIALVDAAPVNPGSQLLELGAHALEVRANGYESREEHFVLEHEKPLNLRIDLFRLPSDPAVVAEPQAQTRSTLLAANQPERDASPSLVEHWWFWTALAVVVGGSAVAIVAATHQPSARPLPMGPRVVTP
jgi:tetratricopeptide (TPR) repeat protein